MTQKFVPELLAPAGSMEALKAAVNAGADAVYFSGQNFGARQYAENFDNPEMETAVNYAHLRGSKVYVTVNTLIKEFELDRVAEYLLWLYQIGADAVIVQDVGVASLCKELVSDLDIHASTQMTINNPDGVLWAQDFGLKRVVLSREMKLHQIEEMTCALQENKIKNEIENKIELEIFAHGALCYCYSGQCLLSSFIGGRSGNRGRCAQPCRKSYEILKGKRNKYGKSLDLQPIPIKESYLLSTRDLALYSNLDRISNLGVDSIKIEGRMRSTEYVAIVVCIYRKALDAIASSPDTWTPDEKDISRLKLAFNRGFTQGHILVEDKDLVMGREAPGNRGLYLGMVSDYEIKSKSALIKLDNTSMNSGNLKLPKLEKGDGVVFRFPYSQDNNQSKLYHCKKDDYKREYGMVIEEKPEYSAKNHGKLLLKTKRPLPPGSKIYMTRDNSLINAAQSLIQKDLASSIPMDLYVNWDEENKAILMGEFSPFNKRGPKEQKHNHKLEILLKADFRMETAIKSPLSKEQIEKQLKKTGGTPFRIRKIIMDYPGNLFTPLSKLNKLRRDFIKEAEIKLLDYYKPPNVDVESAEDRLKRLKNSMKINSSLKSSKKLLNENLKESLKDIGKDVEFKTDIAVYTSSLEAIEGALNSNCKRIYFEPFIWKYYDQGPTCKAIDRDTYHSKIYELILKALKLCDSKKVSLVWKWPSITNPNYFKNLNSSQLMNSLLEEGIEDIMVDSSGTARAITNLNPYMKLCGSPGLNVWNHWTIDELSKTFQSLSLSNELSKEEIAAIISNSRNKGVKTSFELLVQGNLESMISEDCLVSALTEKYQRMKGEFLGIKDAKNRVFPVFIDDEGRTRISNAVELCLIDYLPDLCRMGFNHLVIDARGKTRSYAQDMVALYRRGLECIDMSSLEAKNNLRKLNRKVKKISQGGITTGNFVRGLDEGLKKV